AEIFTWISIEPTSGTLEPGESEEMLVYLDATGIPPWIYEAEIQFNTIPNVGSPVVEVLLGIEGQPWVQNLQAETNCTDVILNWETIPPGMPADSFHVYKDSIWYATTFDTQFVDSLVFPETERTYYATGYFYNGWESNQTNHVDVTVPLPDELEPLNLFYISLPQNLILLSWTPPSACIEPSGYNVYRDNAIIGFIEDTSFLCSFGFYEFWVTAVYYFGESNPSNSIIITGLPETESLDIIIYPNPAKDNLFICSPSVIERIEIFNNIGMSVLTEKANSKSLQLAVSHLNPGIYYIKIETEHDMIVRKILIE
ncbi:MAG: T9SS type A sorting domain-containing protein, partial [Bacteroidales bacterium]|nr:T9SS type A sorting domain-containing protein [Bacteroidales bacterium]